nr:hypothetical protein [uncultured Mediterraneibacter sp.]
MAKRKRKHNVAKSYSNLKNHVTANKKYKDTVFRMLFSDKKNLLSLYNAVSGKAYTDSEKLEIVTLENAIYMGMKNDLAFIINTNIFLYEHQSTYNPNMPLRELFYIADEYQKLVDTRSLYSSTIQRIPAPNFVVFYNGTKEIEDCQIHYLSEAFENFSGDPQLELKVKVLNVNEGHNQALMEQCQILKEYAQYVAKVRCYLKEMPLDDAVNRAVEECIRENILADFLKKNRAEVIKVSIYEYDKELEEEKLRKAEYEAGVRAGITVAFRLAEKAKLNRDDIIQQLCDGMHMTVEEAEKWYEEYKKEQG